MSEYEIETRLEEYIRIYKENLYKQLETVKCKDCLCLVIWHMSNGGLHSTHCACTLSELSAINKVRGFST
jgi:hypothetical protein